MKESKKENEKKRKKGKEKGDMVWVEIKLRSPYEQKS